MSTITSEAVVILIGRALGAIVQIASLRVSTELLSPAQMGSVTLLTSMIFFFNAALLAPVSQYVSRGFLEWRDAGRLAGNLRRYLLYIAVVAVIAAIIAGAIQWQFQLVSGFNVGWVIALVAIYMVSFPISSLGTTGFNLQNQRGKFVVFSALSALLGLAFAAALFKIYALPEVWSLGQFLGLSVACLSLLILSRSLAGAEPQPLATEAKVLAFSMAAVSKFAWPVVIIGALWWIQSQSYRFFLDRVQGVEYVGIFVIGYALAAMPLALYESVYGQFYEPIFYGELKGQDSRGQAQAWNNYARAYLPGVICAGIFVAGGAPFLAQVLVSESFRVAATEVAVWAAAIESLRIVGGMAYQVGIAKVDMRMMIAPVLAGAILAPVGVLILGRFDPLAGTALALLVATIVAQGTGIILSRRWLPITWPFRRILLGAALGMPLILWFELADWLLPRSNLLAALAALGGGGVYLVGTQALLFNLRTRR